MKTYLTNIMLEGTCSGNVSSGLSWNRKPFGHSYFERGAKRPKRGLTEGIDFDLMNIFLNLLSRKAATMPFFNPKKLSTSLVEGIRKDPGACNRALEQPVAFLLLRR